MVDCSRIESERGRIPDGRRSNGRERGRHRVGLVRRTHRGGRPTPTNRENQPEKISAQERSHGHDEQRDSRVDEAKRLEFLDTHLQLIETPVGYLLRIPGRGQAGPQGRAHGTAPTAIQIGCKATGEVLLPTHAQDRVVVAGLAELEIDESVENGRALVRARRVSAATRESDNEEDAQKEPSAQAHVDHHR